MSSLMNRTGSYLRFAIVAAGIVTTVVAEGASAAADAPELRVGRMEPAVVSGKRFESREGRQTMVLSFRRDGSLEAAVVGIGAYPGMWWVDPAGRLCLVGNYWAGGACFEALIDGAGRLSGVRQAGTGRVIEVKAKGAAR